MEEHKCKQEVWAWCKRLQDRPLENALYTNIILNQIKMYSIYTMLQLLLLVGSKLVFLSCRYHPCRTQYLAHNVIIGERGKHANMKIFKRKKIRTSIKENRATDQYDEWVFDKCRVVMSRTPHTTFSKFPCFEASSPVAFNFHLHTVLRVQSFGYSSYNRERSKCAQPEG